VDALRSSWLVRLRWGALLGQFASIGLASREHHELPVLWLSLLVAVTALSNLWLAARGSALEGWRAGLVLVVDVLLFAGLLALSGGPTNPFSVFFLVYVALAALLLRGRWAWLLLALTVVAFGSLFVLDPEAAGEASCDHCAAPEGARFSDHLVGMWVAYGFTACFVVYFIGKVSRALRAQERQLAQVENMALQNERLATLSAFAANAAHELGTPLGTIGLAANELALAIRRGADAETLSSDAELIAREVLRCRAILSDLSSQSGASMGEMPQASTAERVLELMREHLSPATVARLRVEMEPSMARLSFLTPERTLAQMVANLVRNADEAERDAGVAGGLELRVEVDTSVRFVVMDRGHGMPAALASNPGTPFVTTKAGRGGLGLGLYLVRSFAERTGGSLGIRSRVGGGTEVVLTVPRNAIGEGEGA
jgi:two-component system sensor histidine kinase RegB